MIYAETFLYFKTVLNFIFHTPEVLITLFLGQHCEIKMLKITISINASYHQDRFCNSAAVITRLFTKPAHGICLTRLFSNTVTCFTTAVQYAPALVHRMIEITTPPQSQYSGSRKLTMQT